MKHNTNMLNSNVDALCVDTLCAAPRIARPRYGWRKMMFLLVFAFTGTLVLLLSRPVHAQVMRLEIAVDPEFALEDVVPPDTGILHPGSGWVDFGGRGNGRGGRLAVVAMENVDVAIFVDAPHALTKDEKNHLPLRIRLAYLNTGINDPADAVDVDGHSFVMRMHQSNFLINHIEGLPVRLQSYLYVSGSMYVGEVLPGLYQGEVVVRAEYP